MHPLPSALTHAIDGLHSLKAKPDANLGHYPDLTGYTYMQWAEMSLELGPPICSIITQD